MSETIENKLKLVMKKHTVILMALGLGILSVSCDKKLEDTQNDQKEEKKEDTPTPTEEATAISFEKVFKNWLRVVTDANVKLTHTYTTEGDTKLITQTKVERQDDYGKRSLTYTHTRTEGKITGSTATENGEKIKIKWPYTTKDSIKVYNNNILVAVFTVNENSNIAQGNFYRRGEILSSQEYEYDANGNTTKRIYKDKDGNIAGSVEYEYDANGNTTKRIYKDKDGNITGSVEYEYDANGNTTKIISKDKDGNITRSTEEEYDANGNTTKRISKDKDGNITRSVEYEYDANGNTTKIIDKDKDGNITRSTEEEYDANGKRTKQILKDKDGNITRSVEYEYDANGKLTKIIHKDKDGIITELREYEYDANGNTTKRIYKDKDGNITGSVEYEYDANGNTTKIIDKDKDGNIEESTAWEYDNTGRIIKKVFTRGDITTTYALTRNESGKPTQLTISGSDFDTLNGTYTNYTGGSESDYSLFNTRYWTKQE